MSAQVLTAKEVEKKYKEQWVFMIDCQFSDNGELSSGQVAFHTNSRDEVSVRLQEFRDYKGKVALRYIGEIPEKSGLIKWEK
ncbi:MAG: hypothetical protein JW871_07585 [Endomicrobiales bacterium]|nr:hypothetical protein [Endomicrobiales bacterium]